MSKILQVMATSPFADNHILYSLLFFIHVINPEINLDADAPISQIDEDYLLTAATFVELHNGINIPEALLDDKTKTLKQLAQEIRTLSKLTDEQFQKKLMLDIAVWKSLLEVN